MKVSVILTSYNHGEFIKKSIDSVLTQTFQDFELIIIDDCSRDNSCEIIESYNDERIRFVKHEYNYGHGVVKEGVEKYAQGEYVAILHSDDFWEKDKLSKQVDFLENHKDYGAVFTYVQVVNDDDSYYDKENGFYYKVFEQANRNRFEWLRQFFFYGNCLCHPSILIRKNIYHEERLQESAYPYRQIPDLVMWTRLCLKYNIYIIPEKLTCFRVHQKEEKNTSGFSVNSANRNSIEMFSYASNFENLEENDFIEIFPEWVQYSEKDYFNSKYALARMCLLPYSQNYTKLYGLHLLSELLQDEEERKNIVSFYNFTNIDFFALTGEYDIFNKFPAKVRQISTLYYDEYGEFQLERGFRKDYILYDKFIFNECYTVKMDKFNNTKMYFRFDPSENVLIKCKINQFTVNGKNVLYRPVECVGNSEGSDIFGTLDPMYIAEIDIEELSVGEMEIIISGELQRLKEEEIVCYMHGN